MIDWGAGRYETTAEELAPVAAAVVERARIASGESVLDVACGTGNAALLAAEGGASVVGVDAAPRLLEVAAARARDRGLSVDLRAGDLLELPVADDATDVALSVFGVIFATDPARALGELARVLRPTGRAYVTAWVPEGAFDAMFAAMGRVVSRIAPEPRPERFPWFDPERVGPVAVDAGLDLVATERARLAIRGDSPEAYVLGDRDHPMAVAVRPMLERAGAMDEVREAMTAALREGNEDPAAFLVHSPYVIHELRPRPRG